MSLIYERDVPDPKELFVRDPSAEIVTWQGRQALRLSGQSASLALVPGLALSQGRVEVEIGSEGAAYAGIVFRAADTLNYELAYIQPHTSGKWDALQYDPVFHGSNTWQIYHGQGAQQAVEAPPMTWCRLSIAFGDRRAVIRVGNQSPLPVSPLAHGGQAGLVGIWTYLPAHFSNLRVWDDAPNFPGALLPSQPVESFPEAITEWFLEGYGVVTAEPHRVLNLNRYLPASMQEVRLVRWIEMPKSGDLTLGIGFSDELVLQVDRRTVFTGQNTWKNTPDWADRGYIHPDRQVSLSLAQGVHCLSAALKAVEPFGFGLALTIQGDEYNLLPAHLSQECET